MNEIKCEKLISNEDSILMSPHFLSEENNKSLLISVPNISRLKMNGAILICNIEYNKKT